MTTENGMIKDSLLNKSIPVWIAIAKNEAIQIFTKEPKRGKSSWRGEYYINSIIYESIKEMVNNSSLTWASEPEFLELSFVKKEI
ncbi:MAG: hypothetical protein J1F35_06090 [Erysipelotrichales bacterium]|nr:hypothetical protein [Erysipelotrichales bacterium]